jgi:hypothetical protein
MPSPQSDKTATEQIAIKYSFCIFIIVDTLRVKDNEELEFDTACKDF